MKKIGFIDLFIDEWHANHYPQWFREAARGGEYTVAMAWEEEPRNGRPLKTWCDEMGIVPARSIEQVVEECDALCVLAPSNPEVHERLAELPLRSGKPVYLDKPFAPDKAAAERLFALAERHGTPLMSSSALRFASELLKVRREQFAGEEVRLAVTRGGGSSFAEYGIHQVEMIVSLLGVGARRIMQCGAGADQHMVIEYGDNRRAALTLNCQLPFAVTACGEKDNAILENLSDFFPNLLAAILEFYTTGKSPIPAAETIEIAAVVAAGVRGLQQSGEWVTI